MMRPLTPILLLSLAVIGCSNPPPASTEPTTVSSTNTTVTGTVLERLDGPPYSYLRLKTDQGEVWAAVPMDSANKGGQVTITHGAALKNFEAPKLGRRFEVVVFGTVEGG